MASRTLALCASVVLVPWSVACSPKAPPQAVVATGATTAPSTSPVATLESQRAALGLRVPDWRFEAEPLSDAIDRIAAAGAPFAPLVIDVRWDQLKEVGITPETPVTLHLVNARLSKVLAVALEAATPVGGPAKLSYYVDDARPRLIVTTHDDYVLTTTVVRTYDISDFLVGLESRGGIAATAPAIIEQRRAELVADIFRLIEDSVAPNSWKSTGGKDAEISESGGVVTIKQTKENQRQVEQLLASLRETSGRKPAR